MTKTGRAMFLGSMAEIFIIAVLPVLSRAQLSIRPELIVMDMMTDQELVQEVYVTNASSALKEIWIEAEYRWQGPVTDELSAWVQIIPAHFILPAKQGRTVKVKFLKNAVTRKGESHFFLFARENLYQAVHLNVRTGIPVFVRFNRGVKPKGEIHAFLKKRADDGTWHFEAQIKNTGKMYLLPFGLAGLDDPAGRRVWFKEVRLRQPIPPGQMKSVMWQLPPEAAVKGGKISLELFWGTLYGMDQGKIKSRKASTIITW
ncbi:hypothetical protein JW933_10205 [candidate division FCPU426 bacterium]|nr:hypothetical protein [candidate division FCPU426 bacterium]